MSSVAASGVGTRSRVMTSVWQRGRAVREAALTRDIVLLVGRILIAWVFMYHGAGKLFGFKHQGGITGTTAFFHLQGIPAPHFFAYVAGLTEFVGGFMLLVGLITPLVALALVVDMVVAILTTTGSTGMLSKPLGGGFVADGFEINIALASTALIIAVLGAGRISLDGLLGSARRPRPE